MSSDQAVRDLAAAFLSRSGPPDRLPDIDMDRLLAVGASHGVLGLMYGRICESGAAVRLPRALVDRLREAAHRQAARELVQRVELDRIVAACHGRGIELLLMKGSSLAYDVYEDPAWRVRTDVDVLVRESQRAAVRASLEGLGYVAAEASGGLVAYQFHAERIDASRVRHLCDVHWRIANPQRFAEAVAFDELARDAIALPLLGPHARGLGRAHALWLACVHRAAHHYDQDTLVWLYDVHLLVQALDADGAARFVALAERSGVRHICRRALGLSRSLFETRVPEWLTGVLESGADEEASALFLRPGISRIDVLLDDLRALPGWRRRLHLLKEVAFPGASYMRDSYGAGSSAPIAWLYLRRLARGAFRWLRREPPATARR
jgi:hypothetical protein